MDNMTDQDRQFITTLINSVKSDIENIRELFERDISALKDNLKTKLESIGANQTKFREDIIDIYEKYRNLVDRFNVADNKITKLETELNEHKNNHQNSSADKRNWNSIIWGILGALVVGVIMFFIGSRT